MEEIANELALLVAQENSRANEERERRESAEATAAELALLLARSEDELEREREARLRAEAEVRELAGIVLDRRRPQRFSHHAQRGTPAVH